MKNFIYRICPLLLSFVLFLVPIPVRASYGTVSPFTGSISYDIPYSALSLSLVQPTVSVFDPSTNIIKPVNSNILYEGIMYHNLGISGLTQGTILNGTFGYSLTFQVPEIPGLGYQGSHIELIPIDYVDGVTVELYVEGQSSPTAPYKVNILVRFENYFVSNSGDLRLPVQLKVSVPCAYYSTNEIRSAIALYFNAPLDKWQNLSVYTDVRDVPSVYGSLSSLYTSFFNSIDGTLSTWQNSLYEQIERWGQFFDNTIAYSLVEIGNWFTDLKTTVSSSVADLKGSLSGWFSTLFSKMDEDQDELLHGYDDSQMSQDKTEVDNALSDMTQAQDDLQGMADYEVDYSGYTDIFSLQGLVDAISFVTSSMGAMFKALGYWSYPITIGLVVLLVTRIIGYQNFKGG